MISLSFNNFHNMATEGAVDAHNEVVAAPESSTFASEKLRA
jgi:D-lactate dehydrogenase